MEGEEIGVALARASELRSKISVYIHRCAASPGTGPAAVIDDDDEEEEEVEEAESLVSIREALQSLEEQLSALQTLQHQQRYEREVALAQIDRSRMTLLKKLKEYKGEDLEVIKEASNFASESIEQNEGDLLLPPYPSHLPDLYALDGLYPTARCSPRSRSSRNKLTDDAKTKNQNDESGKPLYNQPLKKKSGRGLGFLVGFLTKSAITVLGFVSVLSLAGFKPTLERSGTQLNIMELFNRGQKEEGEIEYLHPPDKPVIMEDGKPTFLGKERVEVPFELGLKAPKIGYGSG